MGEHSEFRMARSDGYFLGGTSLMVVGAMAIASVLIAWAVGGGEFKDRVHGDVALAIGIIVFLAGCALTWLARNRKA